MSSPLFFYYRDGCHLCEDMWHHLQEIRSTRNFEINLMDVDSDASLQARYGTLVPVLAAGEEVICNYYLNPVALERYLDSVVGPE